MFQSEEEGAIVDWEEYRVYWEGYTLEWEGYILKEEEKGILVGVSESGIEGTEM